MQVVLIRNLDPKGGGGEREERWRLFPSILSFVGCFLFVKFQSKDVEKRKCVIIIISSSSWLFNVVYASSLVERNPFFRNLSLLLNPVIQMKHLSNERSIILNNRLEASQSRLEESKGIRSRRQPRHVFQLCVKGFTRNVCVND